MQRKMLLFTVLALAAILVAGCADLGPQATPVPPTKTPKPTFTATPDWTPTPVVFATATPEPPTATPEPEFTATPEATPTETPNPTARLTANQAVNVRSGPGTNYTTIGSLSAGQTFEITGKNPAGDWLEFQFDGRQGWVKSSLVTVSGDMNTVQVAQNIPAPPTARPTARPQPTSPPAQPTAVPVAQYPWSYVSGSAQGAPQCGVVHFDGQVQYKNGSPQNGVCIYLDYYGPRTIKFSGGGGAGDGNWSFAPCGSEACNGPIKIYVVECPANVPGAGLTLEGGSPPAPKSDVFSVTITDKCQQGQWTNIVFRNTQQ